MEVPWANSIIFLLCAVCHIDDDMLPILRIDRPLRAVLSQGTDALWEAICISCKYAGFGSNAQGQVVLHVAC